MRTEQWSRRRAPLAALAALLGVALFGGFIMGRSGWAAEPEAQRQIGRAHVSPAEVARATAPLAEMETGLVMIGEKMEPSVVSIRVDKVMKAPASNMPDIEELFRGIPGAEGQMPRMRMMPQREMKVSGAGSGVIVKSDGWILTNDHVVGGADKVTVKLADGREFPGTVRRDFSSDLALVKINASNLVPAEMGDSDRVRVGQWAMAFGSPFELEKTMTLGIISARARQQEIGGRGERPRAYWNLLQTDAPINPGNSGGALVDIRGRVIGINVAIESPSGGSVGIGFAIPVNTAKDVMDQLIATGHVTRGFLGVGPKSLSPDDVRRTGVSQGALVDSVSDGSPAAKAGIEPGDVIVRLDSKPIVDEISLREAIAHVAPGKTVDIAVHRDGREHTYRATLEDKAKIEARADMPKVDQPGTVEKSAGRKLGIRVQAITPELSKQFHLGTGTGIVVTDVQDGSVAAEAGLQPGDVISRVNGKSAGSPADVTSAVQSARSGDKVDFTIHRGTMRVLVTVTVL